MRVVRPGALLGPFTEWQQHFCWNSSLRPKFYQNKRHEWLTGVPVSSYKLFLFILNCPIAPFSCTEWTFGGWWWFLLSFLWYLQLQSVDSFQVMSINIQAWLSDCSNVIMVSSKVSCQTLHKDGRCAGVQMRQLIIRTCCTYRQKYWYI